MLELIFNLVNCSLGELMGTGQKHCKFDFKRLTTIVLTPKGFKYDPEVEFNLAYIRELQQKGQAIVLQGVQSMTDNTAEDNSITREGSGIKVFTGKNPYELAITFDNGMYFHTALEYIESYNQYDITFFDSDGNVLLMKTKSGDYKGFTLGAFQNGKYGWTNGATANSQTVTIQLINRDEFDKRKGWITAANLDFVAQEDLDGYNDVTLTLTSPAAAATSVSFKVISTPDNHEIPIQGLAKENFRYAVNGTTTTITTLTAGANPGEYTLTVPALVAGQNLTLRLYDSVLNAQIIDAGGILYKSNIGQTIVA